MDIKRIGEAGQLRSMDTVNGFDVRPGFYLQNGATAIEGGVSFTVHTKNGTACTLVLYERKAQEPFAEIPFPENYRIGNVYSMIVFGLDIRKIEYNYRVDGPKDLKKGLLFDKERYLLDPYAKAVTGQSNWGEKPEYSRDCYRARVVSNDFDWGRARRKPTDMRDLIIYELHTRGFTKHHTSDVKHPGTFDGIREKIPYLKDLGINAVELMPIFEFDETRDTRYVNGKKLLDYWGYNPVSFFAPNTSYSSEKEFNREGSELKYLIRELHDNDIEVILDVVFNHTAEGNENGPFISFKGFDNNIYYMLTPDGKYYNFSGCGNTLNCNHPVVQNMILDCLRYWVTDYRIDGFRFDLASILGRSEDGSPLSKPPLLERLAFDPILGRVKLIAEAWDAAGLYQVGTFPSWNRWSEWNGRYRDDMRRFLKGDPGLVKAAAQRMSGSRDIYDRESRGDTASVNFITCHDGFTMWDLYSYNEKHNLDNGWDNTDGDNNNNSWNCGAEGWTDRQDVIRLRKKLVRNAFAALMTSQGVPMMYAGDEFLNTQYGNNNAYCQDNEISWLNWDLLLENHKISQFVKEMIRFRKKHPVLRSRGKNALCGLPSVSFHGEEPWKFKEDYENHLLGVLFAGREKDSDTDDIVYVMMNMHWEPHTVRLPELPLDYFWEIFSDTADEPKNGRLPGGEIRLEERSIIILEGNQMGRKGDVICL